MDEAFPPIYCVHYDGIYLQPVTPPGGAPTANGSSSNASNGWKSFRYIVQPRVVKRRFKVGNTGQLTRNLFNYSTK